jgi:hypothetical protein
MPKTNHPSSSSSSSFPPPLSKKTNNTIPKPSKSSNKLHKKQQRTLNDNIKKRFKLLTTIQKSLHSNNTTTTTTTNNNPKLKSTTNTKSFTTALQQAYSLFATNPNNLPEIGHYILNYLLERQPPTSPIPTTTFLQPILIQRTQPNTYYDGLLTTNDIKNWISTGKMKPKDFTLTKINPETGIRINSPRNVDPLTDYSNHGYSIRILRPQEFSDSVWRICSLLESYWGSGSGANAYWTPPHSQGFAPHYDDVDVFILQLSGSKRWIVHEPDGSELFPILPRVSSRDFHPDELNELTIIHDVTLQPGDLLYLPRGYIHHAKSSVKEHSFHLTISMSQKTTWGDVMLYALTRALEKSRRETISNQGAILLRTSIPRHLLFVTEEESSNDEIECINKTCYDLLEQHVLIPQILDFLKDGLDYVYADFLADRMLPARQDQDPDEQLQLPEQQQQQQQLNDTPIRLQTIVEISVCHGTRMLYEDEFTIVLRHCLRNVRVGGNAGEGETEAEEEEARGIEFDIEDAPILYSIFSHHHQPFAVSDIIEPPPIEGEEEKEMEDRIRVVIALVRERILNVVQY